MRIPRAISASCDEHQLVADDLVGRARRLAPRGRLALLREPRPGAAALGAGHDRHVERAALDVEERLGDGGLDVVAAVLGERGLRARSTDLARDHAAGILIAPHSAHHAHRVPRARAARGCRASSAAARTASSIRSSGSRAAFEIVAALEHLRDADEHGRPSHGMCRRTNSPARSSAARPSGIRSERPWKPWIISGFTSSVTRDAVAARARGEARRVVARDVDLAAREEERRQAGQVGVDRRDQRVAHVAAADRRSRARARGSTRGRRRDRRRAGGAPSRRSSRGRTSR